MLHVIFIPEQRTCHDDDDPDDILNWSDDEAIDGKIKRTEQKGV